VANPPGGNFSAFRTGQNDVLVPKTAAIWSATDATIVATGGNKGQLHELNYFLRLQKFYDLRARRRRAGSPARLDQVLRKRSTEA
jgi:hypothetical protein